MLREAKELGDKLVVILNNDNWLMAKKGFVFMSELERQEILRAITYIDDVVISFHEIDSEDMSVCSEIEVVAPDIFCNGGDRTRKNVPELQLCKELGIKLIWNTGGKKMASSSDLVKQAVGPRDSVEKI